MKVWCHRPESELGQAAESDMGVTMSRDSGRRRTASVSTPVPLSVIAEYSCGTRNDLLTFALLAPLIDDLESSVSDRERAAMAARAMGKHGKCARIKGL
jgi:hypothetical protein